MGRPLNKKYFGNRNIGTTGTADDGIGGEGVASATITGAGTGYTTGNVATFSAPQLPGGVTATGTVVATAGAVDSITITESGSGYTSAPTVDLTGVGGGDATATTVLTVSTGNVGSSTNQENAIIMTAFLTGGSALVVDVIEQVSTDRYKVTDGTRTGIVKLKSSAVTTAGEASIVATDAAAGTYYVTKLTAKKAKLTQGTGTVYVTDSSYPWTFGTADATYCKISNA
tara:strand:- start:520 stop:1203 length:684 start_codon:yes stop_codon:yes gene_type:complete